MKSKIFVVSILALSILAGCKKDNKEAPGARITGRVVYNGQPINVRTNGVQLELWQSGYQLFTKIPVYVNQDGTFSAAVFDGAYKLTRLKGNGPWVDNTDTISVQVNGATNIDVPVTPYFTVQNENFTFNKADTTITATVKVHQEVAGKSVEKISFNVGQTQFVDMNNQLLFAPASVYDYNPPSDYLTQPVTLKLSLNPDRYPDIQNTNRAELRRQLGIALNAKYVFARVGVKTVGVAERIYTTVAKINLQ